MNILINPNILLYFLYFQQGQCVLDGKQKFRHYLSLNGNTKRQSADINV
jgi:hypothetical protein